MMRYHKGMDGSLGVGASEHKAMSAIIAYTSESAQIEQFWTA